VSIVKAAFFMALDQSRRVNHDGHVWTQLVLWYALIVALTDI